MKNCQTFQYFIDKLFCLFISHMVTKGASIWLSKRLRVVAGRRRLSVRSGKALYAMGLKGMHAPANPPFLGIVNHRQIRF
jgi:hypothetical protein